MGDDIEGGSGGLFMSRYGFLGFIIYSLLSNIVKGHGGFFRGCLLIYYVTIHLKYILLVYIFKYITTDYLTNIWSLWYNKRRKMVL